ncbi:MAG: flavin reductase family protein [Methylophilaceae bacterium]
MIKPVELSKAYRLLNHGPTILVSSSFNGKQNIMAAAWNMPLDFDPPKICVVIDKNTYTRELIEASGSFAINVPCVAQANLVTKLGASSGRELQGTDKFAENQLETFAAHHIAAPLLTGCVAWLECKIIPEPHNQNTYDLFIAEVVAAYADERVFSDGRWHFEGHDQKTLDELRTIHHVAGGAYFTAGKIIQTNQP